jgi:hypothetical protein
MTDDEQEVGIDWRAASVSNGRLTVPLTSKASSEWLERLEHVIARLSHGGSGWGEIEVAKKKLQVDGVTPGSESDLHHFVESAALQANAGGAGDRTEDAEEERAGPDQQTTDAFRAFGS